MALRARQKKYGNILSAALCFLFLAFHISRQVDAAEPAGHWVISCHPRQAGTGGGSCTASTASETMAPNVREEKSFCGSGQDGKTRKIDCSCPRLRFRSFPSTRAVRDSAHQHNPNTHARRLCSAPTLARQYVCIFVLQMSGRTRRHAAPREAPSPPQHERKRPSERAARSR